MALKRLLLLTILVNLFYLVSGQAPGWLDEKARSQNYPSNTYRAGFFSEAKVQENEETMNRLKDLAKSDLIESIQVSIKSQSTLRTEEKKGNFNELFIFESVSLTEQDIVGLEIATYYDKKQKRASAFAFVKTQRLRDYYSTIIATGLQAIQQRQSNIQTTLGSGNLNGAIDECFDIRSELLKITHAQSVLLALGVSDNEMLKTETVNKAKGDVSEALFKTMGDDRLTSGNMTHFLVSSIKESLRKGSLKVKVGQVSYEDYQLFSGLSTLISKNIEVELGNSTNLVVVPADAQANFLISGSFKELNNRIEVMVSLVDLKDKKIVSSAKTAIAKKNLENEGIVYLPTEIQKLNIVKDLTLISNPTTMTVKCNDQIDALYKVTPKLNLLKTVLDLKELPVSIYMNTPDNSVVLTADESGIVNYIIRSVRSPIKSQFLYAEVNVPAYLKMDPNSTDFKRLTKDLFVPKTKLQMNVTGNILHVISNESNLGQKLTSPYLKGGILDALTKVGFDFTENPTKADYHLTITADTRVGSSYDGLYFSYLDASISLTDTGSRKEVFSNQYRDIKGAGGNYEGAGTKAYSSSMKKIKDDLVAFFLK